MQQKDHLKVLKTVLKKSLTIFKNAQSKMFLKVLNTSLFYSLRVGIFPRSVKKNIDLNGSSVDKIEKTSFHCFTVKNNNMGRGFNIPVSHVTPIKPGLHVHNPSLASHKARFWHLKVWSQLSPKVLSGHTGKDELEHTSIETQVRICKFICFRNKADTS